MASGSRLPDPLPDGFSLYAPAWTGSRYGSYRVFERSGPDGFDGWVVVSVDYPSGLLAKEIRDR